MDRRQQEGVGGMGCSRREWRDGRQRTLRGSPCLHQCAAIPGHMLWFGRSSKWVGFLFANFSSLCTSQPWGRGHTLPCAGAGMRSCSSSPPHMSLDRITRAYSYDHDVLHSAAAPKTPSSPSPSPPLSLDLPMPTHTHAPTHQPSASSASTTAQLADRTTPCSAAAAAPELPPLPGVAA